LETSSLSLHDALPIWAGRACTRSPMEVSLTISTFIAEVWPGESVAAGEQLFQTRAQAVEKLVLAPGGLAGEIVHLDGQALAHHRLVAVPAVVGHLKHHHGAELGGDFLDKVVEIGAIAENAQMAAAVPPVLVEVQQHGDHLGFRLGVDTAV